MNYLRERFGVRRIEYDLVTGTLTVEAERHKTLRDLLVQMFEPKRIAFNGEGAKKVRHMSEKALARFRQLKDE